MFFCSSALHWCFCLVFKLAYSQLVEVFMIACLKLFSEREFDNICVTNMLFSNFSFIHAMSSGLLAKVDSVRKAAFISACRSSLYLFFAWIKSPFQLSWNLVGGDCQKHKLQQWCHKVQLYLCYWPLLYYGFSSILGDFLWKNINFSFIYIQILG